VEIELTVEELDLIGEALDSFLRQINETNSKIGLGDLENRMLKIGIEKGSKVIDLQKRLVLTQKENVKC